MTIGIDVSQSIYGSGVSDYTIDLVTSLQKLLPSSDLRLFGSSFRRQKDLTKLFPRLNPYPFPPVLMDLVWNRLHLIPIETFMGKIDVFHTSDWTEPPSHAPKVTTVHDLSPFLYPEEMASKGIRDITRTHKAKMNWVVKESRKIICVSQNTADDLQKYFSVTPERIVVIPEALPSRFAIHPTSSQITKIKKQFHLSDYILAIGTLQPRKNLPRLINAFTRYQKSLDLPKNLVIAGRTGWGSPLAASSPNVIFTGYLPDEELRALLAGASVFAYPSLYEGFGLPVLNAFFHGIPVVTSDCSSLPEVAGEAAILINPESEENIAAGIKKAIKIKNKLVTAGYKRLKLFSWDITAQKTLEVYKSLC